MRRIVPLLSLGLLSVGCSLSALDGFSSGAVAPPNDAGGDATPPPSERDGGGGFEQDGGVVDADAGQAGRCITVATADSICDDFDVGSPHSAWSTASNAGSFAIVSSGRSPPNALSFTLPNTGASSSIGPTLARSFSGGYSAVDCTFAGALDEVPANGTADFFNVINAGTDEAGIRLFASGFRLISCRNSSNCKAEVGSGPLPALGQFHTYRAVWSGTGSFQFYLDGELRGTTTSVSPLSSPADPTTSFGLLYRVYGNGGSFKVRVDDIDCRRTR